MQVPGGAVAAGLHAAARPPRLPHRHLLLAAGHLPAAPGVITVQWQQQSTITINVTQGQFLLSLVSFSTPTFLVLVAMAVWLTVLAAYWALGSKVGSNTPYNLIQHYVTVT